VGHVEAGQAERVKRRRLLTDVVTPDGRTVLKGPSPLQLLRIKAGRHGGLATRGRHGSEFYRKIGSKGGTKRR
jgi:crotonobetainyl-CoA:carnitine CoA-transferase CaiB-like acyl-CoA transferase